jgi:hypothetical protein
MVMRSYAPTKQPRESAEKPTGFNCILRASAACVWEPIT